MDISGVKDKPGRKASARRGEPAARPRQREAMERPASFAVAEREREQRLRMLAIGVSVALAVLVPLARQVWRWLRENRMRARLDQEILRGLDG